ncbi:MAG: hypothetical protein P4L81_00570 [Candidatus Pacebacteria bacterium]|nr:hypothetical protein [Candidatus Paceibacterota bacterium]
MEVSSWLKLGKNEADARVNEINFLRLNRDNYPQIEEIFTKASSNVAKHSDIAVDFELLRDGEVKFSVPRFTDEKLGIDSEEYGKKRGVSFSKWASDQAYFFLRDLCHVHQHHSPQVDTILILQHLNGDDLQWRNYVIYSLQHYIIKMKRTSHTADLHRAMGVLGYAKSFYQICIARDAELARKMSNFNYEAIECSLRSRIGENDTKDTSLANKKNWAIADTVGYRNLLIAVLVLIFTAVAFVFQQYIAKNPQKFEEFGQILANSWRLWLGALLVFFLIFWLFLNERHFIRSFDRNNALYRKDFLALGILKPRLIGWISTGASAILTLSIIFALFYRYAG